MATMTPSQQKHSGAVQHALEWLKGGPAQGPRTDLEIQRDTEFAREIEEDARDAPAPQTRMEPLDGELFFQLYVPGSSPEQVDIVWHAERETLVVAVEDDDEASDEEWIWYSATWLPQCEIVGATAWFEADLVRIRLPIKVEYQGVPATSGEPISQA